MYSNTDAKLINKSTSEILDFPDLRGPVDLTIEGRSVRLIYVPTAYCFWCQPSAVYTLLIIAIAIKAAGSVGLA